MAESIQAVISGSFRGTFPSACRISRVSKSMLPLGEEQERRKSGRSGLALTSDTTVPARSPRGRQSMLSPCRVAVRVVPWPRVESMRTSPPARRAFCIISGMPSPTLRVVRVVAKGLVTLSFSSSLMPEPSSRIVMVMSLLSSTDTIISTSAAFARTLFCARSRICSDRSRMGSLTPCIWPGCREYRREPGGRILPH